MILGKIPSFSFPLREVIWSRLNQGLIFWYAGPPFVMAALYSSSLFDKAFLPASTYLITLSYINVKSEVIDLKINYWVDENDLKLAKLAVLLIFFELELAVKLCLDHTNFVM